MLTVDHTVLLPATARIAEAAHLLFLTMEPLASYWMGVNEPEAAETILQALFSQKRNLFSHEFASYVEVDGVPAGLELSYPAKTMKALEVGTLRKYARAAGLRTTLRMVRHSYPLQGITKSRDDDYFLAHLGVLPQFERRGLGRILLERAEARGRSADMARITLTVDAGNQRAIRLYSRAGFAITATISFESLRRRFGYCGYHHMEKPLR